MFKLELVRKTPLGQKDDEDISVSEAIFSAYSDYETDIHLFFNDLILCLSRKGDISDIYGDIVDIFKQIEHGTKEFYMAFLSSSFTTHWDFELITPNVIKIKAKWVDVVYFDKKQSMIKKSEIKIHVSEFMEQWKKIFEPIKNDLLTLGYDNKLEGFYFLENLN
ncbi:hypothetical protein PL246_23340 [Salmonella enterica]|uniref:hypothetical protein n=1 Tax=Salmonella enterica TaxID=28901 RepID=UPI00127051F3|nr:hypothetical protein [Salmonella enterica]ECG1483827.1 hypothetical protein [Salmonella enterica subsp. enterica]ECF6265277.1 hypothetical protein [Salmonella enterica]ECH2659656.1 hypothetical protein [Salmonella enterica]EDP9633566.1 hypothetical protein [Salmonella enterica subsp. enterica]EGG4121064.1 hypothetical protein [Salmonella enterica]